ncbi:conserved Plasmodium protein, unknown function [Plasmodium chabaudi chabaudi]|uniref:RRM domain-containing protein n=1 Tax=Plasmodium chabaudi chabaudi TaxID=31271 RepID=A0A077TU64_PLACU|nr:conserved Plasmodium protein, unknown function [Plasmodium chabaudi chabaudi]SCM25870.1 conserved Plasmodium protein, unknown function [Plasmodium chabaudi chabaudi]VTZ70747.1 conserved Plasmodium protein, unknown function [Plasmodium chabaudi chabaudi]|eukprot:XP_744007.1 conserved Plasmodium protein, unknown function [Plasmodium chabaudi chabaudi]
MLGKRKLVDTQSQKKKKNWAEELDSDSEDIDLDYLNNLDENDKIQLEEVSDKEDELSEQVEKEENTENKDESQNVEDTINDTNNNKNKKRRYDWMSSDDEDIPSDDEEEDIEENDDANDSDNNIENQKYKNGKEENDDDIKNNYSNPIDGYKKENNKIDDIENAQNEIIENINKYSIDRIDIKFEEIEHIVTYVYFHNIHFDCITKNLVKFLENHTKNKIIQINSDKSTNHAIIYKYDEKNDDKVVINKFSHYGKLFVHVKNYQDVLRLLKLNETQFMGRIIKSAQAYRKKNCFFTLQTPSHYKYFIPVAVNEKNKNNANNTWLR